MSDKSIDKTFLAYPFRRFSEIALIKAKEGGASYSDFRFERKKQTDIDIKDITLESYNDFDSIGYAIRLIYEGTWGFASNNVMTEDAIIETVQVALKMAKALSSIKGYKVELAPEPSYTDTYVSDYKINPFELNPKEIIDYMTSINKIVINTKKADFVEFSYMQVQENKYLATSEGTEINQQRIRIYPTYKITKVNKETGEFESMESLSAPVGKGYEYMKDFGFEKEAEEMPDQLLEKIAAPSVEPGKYDLVIDPTNLWLTIHESIGHATEIDRALGFEANFAGTSFVTPDNINKLQYGSKYINIRGDRNQEFGLSTIAYDDDGVAAQNWDIIKDGLFVGYQYNREIAAKMGYERSNGCCFADSWSNFPIQRMPNVSLMPSEKDISTNDLISKVDKGIYIVGNNSWSIDHQRYNFQFTGQRFYQIENGKLKGQLKDVAYQSKTTDFWNSCDGVGGKDTYVLGGSFYCGKGQPSQAAPVSHGAPSVLFRQINILNTKQEK